MDLQKAVFCPFFGVLAHPCDAILLPALHLHDMGDGMLRPAVAWFEIDRTAAGRFGGGVVGVLLEPEGMHAQKRMIARQRLIPVRQRLFDAGAQHRRVAGEEIDLMAGLERQRVARIRVGEIGEHLAGLVPAALGEMAERGDMAALARRRGNAGCGGMACLDHRLCAGLRRQPVEIALERMRHDEVGRGRDRPVRAGDRVADEAAQLVRAAFEMRRGYFRCTGQFVSMDVLQHHSTGLLRPPRGA